MIPTLQQWNAVSWHARYRWAQQHGLTVREARRMLVEAHARTTTPRPPAVVLQLVQPLADPHSEWTDEQHAASLAADADPVVIAQRRADVTGLPLTHRDVLVGLPLRAVS